MFRKVEIEIDVPDGYEPTGKFLPYVVDGRFPDFVDGRLVLRKVKQWRDPVLPADSGKEARLSQDGKGWVEGILTGWRLSCGWYDNISQSSPWKFCQVCDE